MKMPSRKTPRPRYIICPFCESGELVSVGPGFARCRSCGLPLLGSALETLLDVIGLPDASGVHACDCGAIDWALAHADRTGALVLLNTCYRRTLAARSPAATFSFSTPVLGDVAHVA